MLSNRTRKTSRRKRLWLMTMQEKLRVKMLRKTEMKKKSLLRMLKLRLPRRMVKMRTPVRLRTLRWPLTRSNSRRITHLSSRLRPPKRTMKRSSKRIKVMKVCRSATTRKRPPVKSPWTSELNTDQLKR